MQAPAGPVVPQQAATMVAPSAPAEAPATEAPKAKTINSPMVGTFYRSASPGAKAFVDVGTEVAVGQAVCIIEAMKIMNEIDADIAGRIVKILCENGQAVEFGQPLFIVE